MLLSVFIKLRCFFLKSCLDKDEKVFVHQRCVGGSRGPITLTQDIYSFTHWLSKMNTTQWMTMMRMKTRKMRSGKHKLANEIFGLIWIFFFSHWLKVFINVPFSQIWKYRLESSWFFNCWQIKHGTLPLVLSRLAAKKISEYQISWHS